MAWYESNPLPGWLYTRGLALLGKVCRCKCKIHNNVTEILSGSGQAVTISRYRIDSFSQTYFSANCMGKSLDQEDEVIHALPPALKSTMTLSKLPIPNIKTYYTSAEFIPWIRNIPFCLSPPSLTPNIFTLSMGFSSCFTSSILARDRFS